MDADTVGRIEDAGVSAKVYEATRLWIENRDTKLKSRQAAQTLPKRDDTMVYGVDAADKINPKSSYAGTCAGGCGGEVAPCISHRLARTMPPSHLILGVLLQTPGSGKALLRRRRALMP